MPHAPSNGREQRRLTLDNVDVRTDATGDEIRVKGHAAVWDKPAWIGPPKYGFSERFEAGAFKESINGGADVRYLFNHDPNAILARTKSGTLRLREDGSGLSVDADLAPTTLGRDLAILLERGDVNQMSVGMQVLDDAWEEIDGADGNRYEQRTIKRAKLFDVSAVTYPAYEETDAGLRDADLARELRDARGVHVEGRGNATVSTDGDGNVERTPGTSAPVPTVTFQSATGTTTTTGNAGNVTITAPNAPSPTPPAGGESPEGPVPNNAGASPGPATATPDQLHAQAVRDSERPLLDLINEHAFTDSHRLAPRILCPACKRPATATES